MKKHTIPWKSSFEEGYYSPSLNSKNWCSAWCSRNVGCSFVPVRSHFNHYCLLPSSICICCFVRCWTINLYSKHSNLMHQRPQTPFNHHDKNTTNGRFECSTRKKVASLLTTPVVSYSNMPINVSKRSPWKDEVRNTHSMIDDALKQVESLRMMIQSMKPTRDSSSSSSVPTISNQRQYPITVTNLIVSPSSMDHVQKSPRQRQSICQEQKSRKTILQYSSLESEPLCVHYDDDLFSPLHSLKTFSGREFPPQSKKHIEKIPFPTPGKIDQTTKDLHSLSLKLLPPNGKLTIQPMAIDPILSSPCKTFPFSRGAK